MQYKLIGSNDIGDIVKTILVNRGVKEPNKYLNLTEECTCDWNSLDNMDAAVGCFTNHFERGDDIAVLVDSDP